jgi:SAM-dependent methyltransferase
MKHTASSYDGKALEYAAGVDTKPWNAFYERPAMLSLLPPLANARVLDAGCGSGWYCEYLLNHGAKVTAVDYNDQFVELTKARVSNRARVLQADLAEPLEFAQPGEFDLVICPLVLHYLKDWEPVLREFQRILRVSGLLAFSTHHPTMDWKLFKKEDYFAVDLLEDAWDMGKVSFYRRPLTAISRALHETGFVIERLLEPQPTEDFRRVHPEGYERVRKNPWFLVVRARKDQ